MVGMRNAPCSVHLKHEIMDSFAATRDIGIHVFGYHVNEADRFYRFQDNHPDWKCEAPLIEAKLSKEDCLAMVDRAGILLPITYRMGYDNANCIGCPKGGQNYWQAIREDFPEQFVEIQTIQDEIGPRRILSSLPELAPERTNGCHFRNFRQAVVIWPMSQVLPVRFSVRWPRKQSNENTAQSERPATVQRNRSL